ncbi:Elongation factor 2 [Cardamine amara subsp. amara]|uniref:Elongation factor 2 n=1 Tax=Cardamine amara subsp. amara TaxID=228776 RepID=A0ABD0ZTH7_CARAN
MAIFTADELRSIMDYKQKIRNMNVISLADHWKPTVTDSLVAAARIIAQELANDQAASNSFTSQVPKPKSCTTTTTEETKLTSLRNRLDYLEDEVRKLHDLLNHFISSNGFKI